MCNAAMGWRGGEGGVAKKLKTKVVEGRRKKKGHLFVICHSAAAGQLAESFLFERRPK